jgi:hypothetical protein
MRADTVPDSTVASNSSTVDINAVVASDAGSLLLNLVVPTFCWRFPCYDNFGGYSVAALFPCSSTRRSAATSARGVPSPRKQCLTLAASCWTAEQQDFTTHMNHTWCYRNLRRNVAVINEVVNHADRIMVYTRWSDLLLEQTRLNGALGSTLHCCQPGCCQCRCRCRCSMCHERQQGVQRNTASMSPVHASRLLHHTRFLCRTYNNTPHALSVWPG